MMREAFRFIAAGVAAATLLALPAVADIEDDSIAVVESLHAALLELAQAEPMPGLEQRVAALTPVISQTHDLERMGRLTVGRFWRSWTEDQRLAFIEAFGRLSVTTYASRFVAVGPDTFEVSGSEAIDDQSTAVETLIHRPEGEPVEMNYDLHLDRGSWRIAQIRADGVSELGLMRSKYYEILDADGFAGLIESIESEIADYYDK